MDQPDILDILKAYDENPESVNGNEEEIANLFLQFPQYGFLFSDLFKQCADHLSYWDIVMKIKVRTTIFIGNIGATAWQKMRFWDICDEIIQERNAKMA